MVGSFPDTHVILRIVLVLSLSSVTLLDREVLGEKDVSLCALTENLDELQPALVDGEAEEVMGGEGVEGLHRRIEWVMVRVLEDGVD